MQAASRILMEFQVIHDIILWIPLLGIAKSMTGMKAVEECALRLCSLHYAQLLVCFLCLQEHSEFRIDAQQNVKGANFSLAFSCLSEAMSAERVQCYTLNEFCEDPKMIPSF